MIYSTLSEFALATKRARTFHYIGIAKRSIYKFSIIREKKKEIKKLISKLKHLIKIVLL